MSDKRISAEDVATLERMAQGLQEVCQQWADSQEIDEIEVACYAGELLLIVQRCGGAEGSAPPTIESMSGLVDDFTEGKSLREYMEDISDDA
jgi:hypothetical protein